MKDSLYEVSSISIAAVLFITMAVVIEVGYWIGCRVRDKSTEPARNHTAAIQGSLLGILALLLGFTFSISLGRHDTRSEAVVNEANSIGTVWLRAQMLPEPARGEIQAMLRDYVNLRVIGGDVSVVRAEQHQELLTRTNVVLDALWTRSRDVAIEFPNPVTSGLYIQALNDMIDSYGSREAALNRHVPELVLILLYATFLMTGCVIGFTAGLAGHRTSFVTYIMVGLIVVLVFIIVDLDRPRRGLIRINHASLEQLQKSMARVIAE